jgi:serine protease
MMNREFDRAGRLSSGLVPLTLLLCLLFSFVPGEHQVFAQGSKYKPAAADYLKSAVWVKVKTSYASVLSASNGRVASLPGVVSARPLVAAANVPSGRRGPVNQTVDITRYHTLLLEPGKTVDEAIVLLSATGYFEAIEPIYNNHPLLTPNDPIYGSQAYLGLIKAADAWDITEGDDQLVIGVVDTGGDLTHPDLVDKLYVNPQEPIDGIDNDNDGYIDNDRGWDFSGDVAANVGLPGFKGDNDPSVTKGGLFGHGTMVAGCAAASTNNGVGIASVGNRAKLLFTKHFSDDQDAYAANYSSNTYLGVLYAATHGARIINCSWGSYSPSTIAQDLINYVTQDLGCLVIAAAGNSNLEAPIYPASYDNVLSVGSTTINDERTYFSNFGRTVDIMAPGDLIVTTQYKDTYVGDSGTSLSAPIVSGAAALVWTKFPDYTPQQVAEQLRVSSDASIYDKNPTFLYKLGYGRLDVLAALTHTGPAVRIGNKVMTNGSNGTPIPGETALLYLDFTNYLEASSSSLSAQISTSSPYATVVQNSYSIGRLATGETRRNTGTPFTIELSPSLPFDEVVEILVTVTDGAYEDHQLINFSVDSFIEIHENNIITSLSGNARIGYGAPDTQSRGSGFLYNEEHLLYEMGLVVGTSVSDLQNNVRGVGGTYADDFSPQGQMKKITPGDRSYSEVFGSTASNNGALDIAYRSLVWNENPDRNFIIVEYVVKNKTATAMNDLYFGLFADWDIADQGAHDRAGWDEATRLGYVFPMTGPQLPRTGIQALTGQPQYYAIDNDQSIAGNPFGLYDGFTDDEKFTTISSGVGRADAGAAANGGDVSHTVGSGPYTINAGETITIAFALHAAMSQNDLIASAQRADTVYNYTLKAPVPSIGVTMACTGSSAVLKPTGAGTYHLYRSFTGGDPVSSGPALSTSAVDHDTVVYIANADHAYESLRVPATISVVAPPTLQALGETSFCKGDSVVLDAGEGDGYLWSTGALSRELTIKSDGDYWVQVKTQGIYCVSTNSAHVVTFDLPDATFTTQPEIPDTSHPVTFTANMDDAMKYLWKVDGIVIDSIQPFNYVFPDEGMYRVGLTVTSSFGCKSSSEQEIGLITGIETNAVGFALYPNPVVDDLVHISVPSGRNVVLEVFDAMGRRQMILQGSAEDLSFISTKSLHNGQYMLRIKAGKQVVGKKFVVAR